ncbi:unnamed protein product [Rotaria sp. Silwood2]|nr:unnamed protein product [Rotaria sp. Silwood2]
MIAIQASTKVLKYSKTLLNIRNVIVNIVHRLFSIAKKLWQRNLMPVVLGYYFCNCGILPTWFDDRLSWILNASINIEVVMLPVKSIWIPDTMILNSADASGYLTVSDYSLASVYYTGQVYMILPALTIKTRLIDTSGYSEHPLWELNDIDLAVINATDRAPFEDTYNAVISIQLFLQRKPLFFMMNGIFACFILNCVTLLSYALPFAPQIGLCMTCFMTYSVYSLNFSNLFSQQSQYLMMITLYFLLSICWTLLSMMWFIVYNYFTTKAEMPKSLYDFCGRLPRVFFCCFPLVKQDNKINQQKDVIAENQTAKPKCNFCSRCESCQVDFDKDKVKGKNKKEIETRCNALNYLVFLCLLLCMFVSNLAVWLSMSK